MVMSPHFVGGKGGKKVFRWAAVKPPPSETQPFFPLVVRRATVYQVHIGN